LQQSLYVSKWQDDVVTEPASIVVLVPGLTQQPFSLNALAGQLAAKGHLVFAITTRGHGDWHTSPNKKHREYKFDIKESVNDITKYQD
jgi:alpha-beta hydrolase superfamily lysophospholipase